VSGKGSSGERPVFTDVRVAMNLGTCLGGTEDEEEGYIGLSLDDFGVPLPGDFVDRWSEWERRTQEVVWPGPPLGFDVAAHEQVGRDLAQELSLLLGQPVRYG
jgi:hypothetical protein